MPSVAYVTDDSDPLAERIAALARDKFELVMLSASTALDEQADALAGVKVLIAGAVPLSPLAVDRAPGINLVQLTTCDTRGMDPLALRKRGTSLAGISPAVAPYVAELTVGLMVASLRVIGERGLRNREEVSALASDANGLRQLASKRVGIIGLGRVGQAVTSRLADVGAQVVYADIRAAEPHVAERLGVRRISIDLLYSSCDIVSLHLPWGPTADPLIDHRDLALMGPESILVNTADGRVVNEEDFVAALRSGPVAAAALDVVADGVPTEDHTLLRLGNVVATPYVAARSSDANEEAANFVVDNVARVLRGEQPIGLIEPAEFPPAGDPSFWSSQMYPRTT